MLTSYHLATSVFLLFITCAAARARGSQIHPSEPGVNVGDMVFSPKLFGGYQPCFRHDPFEP
jgi:hypothetical protein